MVIEGREIPLMSKILNKQFEMIGEKMTFEDLPVDGILIINNKKVRWYDHYKWDSWEQYQEWKKYAKEELKILGERGLEKFLNYMDFRYGFIIRYKKEGLLF